MLTSRRPRYLLGALEAKDCCGLVIDMYCAAGPPQVFRGGALVAALLQCAPDTPCTTESI